MSDPDPLDFAVDLDDVRERIKVLRYFLTVDDIETASRAIEAENAAPPAAFVSIQSETAEANKTIGGHSQRVSVSLSVLFCEPLARSDRETRDVMERTRKALIRQLVAWTPRNAGKALQYERYLLRAVGAGLIWGEVLFRTEYRLTL